MRILTHKNVRLRAKELRSELTAAEQILWENLRNRRLFGHKFRRQVPIGPYVVDFYCHEKRLAIEVDGGQHCTQEGLLKDSWRSKNLAFAGVRVIRFPNRTVLTRKELVLNQILECLR